ncbi:WD40-repeat-containing domain protein [Suillus lakei]|nr:WD40-repeat-containing domain protein [Suillus lakei]
MATRFLERRASKDTSTPAQFKRPAPKHRFEGHENAVEHFVFLHDNVHIVSGSWDDTMRKWNCDTGLVVGEPWRGEGGGIYALALSPDGKTIACGREDGSVERWNTNGEMMEGVWTGHSDRVQSLSWSPRGSHIASGSHDEIILIRNAASGELEVDPIDTKQMHVFALAYSPSGDRIASGGETFGKTICIWNTTTGSLIFTIKGQDLGGTVTSLVWSPDSSKLYSAASDKFARVFDSTLGHTTPSLQALQHREWDVAQLWNTESYQPLGQGEWDIAQLWNTESYQPHFRQSKNYCERFYCVMFSQDERYVAYGGDYGELTLWTVKDIAPGIKFPISRQGQLDTAQQQTRRRTDPQQDTGPDQREETRPDSEHENRPKSSLSSCLDADATGDGGIIEETRDDPYNNFYQSSQTSIPVATSSPPQPPNPARRFWNMISRHYMPAKESPPLQERHKLKFLARHARSNSPLQPAQTTPDEPTPEGKVRAGEEDEEGERHDDLSASKPDQGKGKEREEYLADAQNPPPDDHIAKLKSPEDRNFLTRLLHARGRDPTPVNVAPETKHPSVVEVSAVRGFQRYIAMTPKRRMGSSSATFSLQMGPTHIGGSSQPGPSSQIIPAQTCAPLQTSSWQGGPSTLAMVGRRIQYMQAVGDSPSYTSPSHFVAHHAVHDADSDSIQGSCNKFLDKICFPCGHHEDS